MNYLLSNNEIELVTNPEILLAKNKIIIKVYELFGTVAKDYLMLCNELTPFDFKTAEAKISKGENYQGLPYVMLDYPRNFSKESSIAIRSFFWWGHFFSITLHLSGKYQQQFSEKIHQAIHKNLLNDWYICTSDNQWEHHFDLSNYTSITDLTFSEITNLPFLKIAKNIPLKQWDQVHDFYTVQFKLLIKILNH